MVGRVLPDCIVVNPLSWIKFRYQGGSVQLTKTREGVEVLTEDWAAPVLIPNGTNQSDFHLTEINFVVTISETSEKSTSVTVVFGVF